MLEAYGSFFAGLDLLDRPAIGAGPRSQPASELVEPGVNLFRYEPAQKGDGVREGFRAGVPGVQQSLPIRLVRGPQGPSAEVSAIQAGWLRG
ncbi:MAG: hypothetical protein KIT69_12760 [Propionibacteriaceae bacterium]|nr:hypothetical protein [Propionibacteriaceae bacterium]